MNNCKEYTDISPGCIICDYNDNYKSEKKCQFCKSGYFKTKEDTCIYCSSEKYGGPSCYECEYEKDENGQEKENIICKNCSNPYQALSSNGKCYDCDIELSCPKCEFIKYNNYNKEKLVCTECYLGYYMNLDGKCVNFLHYLKKIPYCYIYTYQIKNNNKNTIFYYYDDDDQTNYYEGDYGYEFILPEINSSIDTKCISCEIGYNLDKDGKCIPTTFEECSLISIIQNFPLRYYECYDFCYIENFAFIDILFTNNTIDYEKNKKDDSIILDLDEFLDIYSRQGKNIYDFLDNDLKSLLFKTQLCISNSGKGGKNEPKNLNKCLKAKFIESNNSYICTKCFEGYYLDNLTNLCIPNMTNEKCFIENIGNELNPIYSCKKCYNEDYSLITIENGVKICMESYGEMFGCIEGSSDSSYINSLYNCILCSYDFIPYYSYFFDRKICYKSFEYIERYYNRKANDNYEDLERIETKDGMCERDYLFTPDGIYCYLCNDKIVGMPGCKGPCSYSSPLYFYNSLKCKVACKTGYIETSKGKCELCDNVNKGCYECHYDNKYPVDFYGIKRKRRFVCDFCEDGYAKLENGKCIECSKLGHSNCAKCAMDINTNELICSQCSEGYVLDKNGYCTYCNSYYQVQRNNYKCINCYNVNDGGIKGCSMCERNNNKIICQFCKEGYILLKNNNTCLERVLLKDKENFERCEQLSLDNNNKYYCSRCKKIYSLLKENNKSKCEFIPSLYDIYYSYYYSYYFPQYYYDIYYPYYPCQESVNLGTIDKPLYSCIKCYQLFEYEKNFFEFTKIINEENNLNICAKSNYFYELENCTEAINKTKNGIEKYDCIKCYKNNILKYDSKLDTHYCIFNNNTNKCIVKYCKICDSYNNYFCSSCLTSDYKVNNINGACVKRTDIMPFITWKDIYGFQLFSSMQINSKYIYGPLLKIRGITHCQINSRHAFLIYLIFKLKNTKTIFRKLEELKNISAICEIVNEVDEISYDINIVDYDCIGIIEDGDNFTDYELINIEEGNNDEILKKTNLKKIISETDFENLEKNKKSDFTFDILMKIIVCEMYDVKNYTTNNYIFDFSITGYLNKFMNNMSIYTQLELIEINEKANCTFIIKEYNSANLNCYINIEEYKEIKTFSFKTLEIKTEDEEIIYLNKLNEVVLINEYQDDIKKKNYIVIIIICIVGGVFLIAGIIITIFLVKKYKRKKANIINNDKSNIVNNIKNKKQIFSSINSNDKLGTQK